MRRLFLRAVNAIFDFYIGCEKQPVALNIEETDPQLKLISKFTASKSYLKNNRRFNLTSARR